jgi:membrane protein
MRGTFFRSARKALPAAGRTMLTREIPRDAAGISYFCLIALVPTILVVVALVDAFLGWMDLHGVLIQRIIALFPGSRDFLRSNLSEITAPSPAVVLSCIIVVLWSSSWIFTFIESSINRAWDVSSQRTFWESRVRSIAFMFLVGTSLLTSAAITAYISAVRARASLITASASATYIIGRFWHFVLLVSTFLIAVLIFTLVFKWIPHRKVFWREAFTGALVTTLLWEIGSYIFGKIVPSLDYQRIYGKMGAVIALLAWVYTSNIILLFGANYSAQLHSIISELPDSHLYFGEKVRRFPSGP